MGFLGREEELNRLEALLKKRSASLIVVRGRRRIGKSRLLAEFGKGLNSIFLTGIPPGKKTTAQSQRDEFVQQMQRRGLPAMTASNWGDLFWAFSRYVEKGRFFVVFDEISWMGGKSHDFLGQLKTAWDLYFSKNSKLVLVLCGSISSWIEENILSSTGFLGRITLDLVLEELPLRACNGFWEPKAGRISTYEKFKVLSVTGGVPLYLEQIEPGLSAEQNILNLCFAKGGLLVREFDQIFSDLFAKRSSIYKEVVELLANGSKEQATIYRGLEKSLGGGRSRVLSDLVKAGFLQRDFTWSLENGEERKLSRYRLSDNYVRFYLKYIAPNRSKIDRGLIANSFLAKLPHWESLMGLQFENLVVHNRNSVWEALGLKREEIVMDGPYFQSSTQKRRGCQIDYMIQTRFHTLYVCEIKFSKHAIGIDIIEEMERKRKNLQMPRYCSFRPVLIHVNGVEERVLDEDYFDHVVDFGSLLD